MRAVAAMWADKGLDPAVLDDPWKLIRVIRETGGSYAQLQHLTLSGLPRLACVDVLVECTHLQSLHLEGGLDAMSDLPDLSALSGLEVRAEGELPAAVYAWAQAHGRRRVAPPE